MRALHGVPPCVTGVAAPPSRSQLVQLTYARLTTQTQHSCTLCSVSCGSTVPRSSAGPLACHASSDESKSLYSAKQADSIQESWQLLMRWSKAQERERDRRPDTLQTIGKVAHWTTCISTGRSASWVMLWHSVRVLSRVPKAGVLEAHHKLHPFEYP